MDRIFFYSPAPCDQPQDTTYVAADVLYISHGKSVLQISSDELLLAQVDDLKIIQIVRFEVAVGPRSRTVQFLL